MIEHCIVYFLFYFLLLLMYLPIARRFNITDKPNQRSSHSSITITGAGFIFPLAFLIPLLVSGAYIHYRALLTALFMLTCISYLDDLRAMKKLPRIIIQILAVGLLLWQTGGLFRMTVLTLIPAFVFVVGIINAYNFMDGINGITVIYSIVTTATLYYLSIHGFSRLPNEEVFFSLLISLSVFGFFNIRKKALLFCGDAGSITLAFIISFLVIQMMIMDDDGKWILLIGVYGLDAVATIFLRLIRRENVGEAHRTHFYQFLTRQYTLSHIAVSVGFALVQLAINVALITLPNHLAVGAYLIVILVYVLLRLKLEGTERLFKKYNK